jgi:ABC-2 type transport system ATP-binding protein
MIAGMLIADAGVIEVCGYPMGRDGRRAKAHLAYVPDQPFLYDKLTAREFLHFVGQMYSLKKNDYERRSQVLIDRLEMGNFLDQLAEGYSHGMKQRTVLAAALLHDPKVLVIDEPMVGLDPKTVRTVKNLMGEMTAAGGTVFMSTHTLAVAEAVADRIGIIHHGRLVAIGTLEQLQANGVHSDSLEDVFLSMTADEEDGHARETIPT